MKTEKGYNYLTYWTESQIAKGKYTFTAEQLKQQFSDLNAHTLISALTRMIQKKKVVALYAGFYTIISPEYSTKGIIPPLLIIDSLMNYLNRQYYVGLLNAAALYGAAHQRPQEFFVVTTFPTLRATMKNGMKINYISRVTIPEKYTVLRKTETGYVKVSGPELTAVDLLQYENHIGGLNRAATIISELADSMTAKNFSKDFLAHFPTAILQRLGFILENISKRTDLADSIHKQLSQQKRIKRRAVLKAGKAESGFETDKKWKIVINTKMEIDE
jgi:predicted transcriptional regulator of viral defense system